MSEVAPTAGASPDFLLTNVIQFHGSKMDLPHVRRWRHPVNIYGSSKVKMSWEDSDLLYLSFDRDRERGVGDVGDIGVINMELRGM